MMDMIKNAIVLTQRDFFSYDNIAYTWCLPSYRLQWIYLSVWDRGLLDRIKLRMHRLWYIQPFGMRVEYSREQ